MTPLPEPRAAASARTPDPTLVEMFAARLLAHRTPKSALRPQQAETDEPDLPAMQNDDFEATSEPAAVNLPPVVIPASQLLICHSLAATFGSLEDIERFRAPGAFSILQGFGAENHDLILNTLKVVLPDQGWQIVSPSVSDGAVSKTAAERMLREANRSLDITTPVLVLQPYEISLPMHFQSLGIYQLTYAPVSPEILLSVLAALNRAPDDEQAFKAALPERTLLARLEMAEIAAVLRFGSGVEIAERLSALACAATEGGPRLDLGFADSPAVGAARRLVADLKAWQRGEIGWSDCSHSLLVYGPPGTGKTWLPCPRLIITPGLNKYRNGYESPFDKHREKGNDAIDRASRLLILGYGFNDDHLETHLTPRIRSGARTVILTRSLSPKARTVAFENRNVIAAEFHSEAGVDGTRFIIDRAEKFYPGIDYWDLDGFVRGVLTA